MRIVCLSDTHCRTEDLVVPDGDLLLHAGDLTRSGDMADVHAFDRFLATLPHPRKVVIAGNHDWAFERQPAEARAALAHADYLFDEEIEIGGLRIWGSPWQPWFFDWAFNLERGAPIRAKWDRIPEGIDVLVTHGPPVGHGDTTVRGERVGCADLLEAVRRVRPRLHVFGHIHEGYGVTVAEGTTFANASTCDVRYRPLNAPLVFDTERLGGPSRSGESV